MQSLKTSTISCSPELNIRIIKILWRHFQNVYLKRKLSKTVCEQPLVLASTALAIASQENEIPKIAVTRMVAGASSDAIL